MAPTNEYGPFLLVGCDMFDYEFYNITENHPYETYEAALAAAEAQVNKNRASQGEGMPDAVYPCILRGVSPSGIGELDE